MVSLSESDLEDITNHTYALNNIRAFLFVVTRPTFDAFCSIITRGRSSRAGFTNRKLFRNHCLDLFRQMAIYGSLTTREEELSWKKFSFAKNSADSFSNTTDMKVAKNSVNSQTSTTHLNVFQMEC